jgi:hypothetical protein
LSTPLKIDFMEPGVDWAERFILSVVRHGRWERRVVGSSSRASAVTLEGLSISVALGSASSMLVSVSAASSGAQSSLSDVSSTGSGNGNGAGSVSNSSWSSGSVSETLNPDCGRRCCHQICLVFFRFDNPWSILRWRGA